MQYNIVLIKIVVKRYGRLKLIDTNIQLNVFKLSVS
jgi:hypothetical protein